MKRVLVVLFMLPFLAGAYVWAMPAAETAPAQGRELNIGTASVGGAYYAMGGGIANLVTEYVTNITMVPVVTGGSVENPRLVDSGDVDIAISNSNLILAGFNGEEPYGKKLKIQAIASMYSSVFHIITLEGSSIKSVADLKGKRVGVGPAGGGTSSTMVPILEAYGMTPDDFTPSYLAYGDSTTQLADGKLDAVFIQSGYPASAVMQLRATHRIRFIDLDRDKLDQILTKYPIYSDIVVPADVYDLSKDALALGIPNVLIVRPELSEELVYNITAAIFDHLKEFGDAVATAKQIDATKAMKTVIPLHPGAARYFNK